MKCAGLVLLSVWCVVHVNGAGDFADEFGMNTGPVEPEQEKDQSLFASDPTGTDAEQAVPFVVMNNEQFQAHARSQYFRVLNRMNEQAQAEDLETVYVHLTPPDLEM